MLYSERYLVLYNTYVIDVFLLVKQNLTIVERELCELVFFFTEKNIFKINKYFFDRVYIVVNLY